MILVERTLTHYWNLVEYRILRPRAWRAVVQGRVERLRDEEFRKHFPYHGSADEWLAEFHLSARLRYFFHPRNQKDFFLQLLTRTQPFDQILQEADDVLGNRFDTLGSGKVELGAQINWQRDFKSGKEWLLNPSWELDILDLGNPSDVKVPWELSRFHQVWWLGKAYWLTRNERYAEKFRDLVNDWIEQNPVGKGVNWTVAMEVAIRACNWIAGYYFFCESKSLSNDFWMKFLKSLYVHGLFVRNNLEYARRSGNHFLSNVVGLTMLGIFFSDTQFGKEWLRWGIRSLPQEMERQVYPDGVNYEKSTSYHRLVLELFYTATILCRKNNIRFGQSYMQSLERMFEFVRSYTRPDGSIPLVGDADDGRLFRFCMSEDVNDHRHALSVGAILFNRIDFKLAAGRFGQDALWLFGGEGFERHQLLRGETPPAGSHAFPDGGFYIMRSDDAHVFIDAGDIGMKGRGGHGHNDTLSFELWADGESVIVDSGTYAYTFDIQARQEFRSTSAHNTVMIDGKELAEFAGLWTIKEDRSHPQVLEWMTSPDRDVLEAEHSAYAPVVHRRRVELSKDQLRLQIADTIRGEGKHTIESYLHFAPHVGLELRDTKTVTAKGEKRSYRISVSTGEFEILDTWFSRSYGVRARNKTLRIMLKEKLPVRIEIEIQPA